MAKRVHKRCKVEGDIYVISLRTPSEISHDNSGVGWATITSTHNPDQVRLEMFKMVHLATKHPELNFVVQTPDDWVTCQSQEDTDIDKPISIEEMTKFLNYSSLVRLQNLILPPTMHVEVNHRKKIPR